MVSLKTKHAIKALIALAEEKARGGASLTMEEIAARGGTPKRFLEHILIEIRNAGYIGSRRGRIGWYFLIKEPQTISVGAILRLVDGTMAPLPAFAPSLSPLRRLQGRGDVPDPARLRPGLRRLPAAHRVDYPRRPDAGRRRPGRPAGGPFRRMSPLPQGNGHAPAAAEIELPLRA
jgi:Rrf2 family protein